MESGSRFCRRQRADLRPSLPSRSGFDPQCLGDVTTAPPTARIQTHGPPGLSGRSCRGCPLPGPGLQSVSRERVWNRACSSSWKCHPCPGQRMTSAWPAPLHLPRDAGRAPGWLWGARAPAGPPTPRSGRAFISCVSPVIPPVSLLSALLWRGRGSTVKTYDAGLQLAFEVFGYLGEPCSAQMYPKAPVRKGAMKPGIIYYFFCQVVYKIV